MLSSLPPRHWTKPLCSRRLPPSRKSATGTPTCWPNPDEEQKQISTTDPDTRRMHTANGNVVLATPNWRWTPAQILIAAATLTNDVTDLNQLANVALKPKRTWQSKTD